MAFLYQCEPSFPILFQNGSRNGSLGARVDSKRVSFQSLLLAANIVHLLRCAYSMTANDIRSKLGLSTSSPVPTDDNDDDDDAFLLYDDDNSLDADDDPT